MKSKASAPGKIILFGEHFVVYGIKAILCTIDKRVTVTAEKTDEQKISINSAIGNLTVEPNQTITKIESPLKPFYFLANKILQEQNQTGGIKITIDSEIPVGLGLGSSSACCVAGAAAISGLFEKKTREDILKIAIDAEKTIFKNTSGADCTVCTYGGIMQYDVKNGFTKINTDYNLEFVIGNSNTPHSTYEIVKRVKQFKDENKEEFSRLCEEESRLIQEVLILLEQNKIKKLGEKMNQNQEYLEKIGISNEKLREMIKLGQKSTYGAKITGAGGGGCIITLTDKTNQNQAINQFREHNHDCFDAKIDFEGLHTF